VVRVEIEEQTNGKPLKGDEQTNFPIGWLRGKFQLPKYFAYLSYCLQGAVIIALLVVMEEHSK
jgi:hypothetical protein